MVVLGLSHTSQASGARGGEPISQVAVLRQRKRERLVQGTHCAGQSRVRPQRRGAPAFGVVMGHLQDPDKPSQRQGGPPILEPLPHLGEVRAATAKDLQ